MATKKIEYNNSLAVFKILEKRTKPVLKSILKNDSSLRIEDCQVNSD